VRVLHVIESLERGGAERVLAVLADALRGEVELHVASLIGLGPVAEWIRAAGASVYTLRLSRRGEFWRALPQLEALTLRLRPNIVHAHLRFSELYAATLVRPPRCRLVATFHNTAYDAEAQSAFDRGTRFVQRHVLARRFDRFFAVSQQAAKSYQHHLGLDSVEVIPNPVSVERVRRLGTYSAIRDTAARLRASAAGLAVQVGNLRPQKGHLVSLKALASTPTEHRWHLVLVGEGPLRGEIEREIEVSGLAPWVTLVGEVNYESSIGWMGAADVVIQPSHAEGLPMTVLEAMALGRPVVGTRVGGIPEAIADGDTGLLIDDGDCAGLAARVGLLLRDREAAARLGDAAEARVRERYDAPRIAATWLDAYRRVLH